MAEVREGGVGPRSCASQLSSRRPSLALAGMFAQHGAVDRPTRVRDAPPFLPSLPASQAP